MQYPKPIMKITEMAELGFPVWYLRTCYWTKGQTFAVKANPKNKNSPILFDTEKFEKWRLQQEKLVRPL